jgi:predicted ester cyclase
VSPGPKGHKDLLAKYTSAFPDTKFTLGDVIAEGDLAAARWSVHGTQRGEIEGIAATNREVNLTGMIIARIAKGKIAETWSNWDALGMLQQLGVAVRAKGA